VGYLTSDLERGSALLQERFALEPVRRFERPQFALAGAYLGAGSGCVEVFTFTDPQLLAARLPAGDLVLDHVAYEVDDLETLSASLRRGGVRFCGPDLRGELAEPADLGGVLHLWTVPETCNGLSMQLMQRLPSPRR
jgi:hypothetical protein